LRDVVKETEAFGKGLVGVELTEEQGIVAFHDDRPDA
jgi:hypothetical protein